MSTSVILLLLLGCFFSSSSETFHKLSLELPFPVSCTSSKYILNEPPEALVKNLMLFLCICTGFISSETRLIRGLGELLPRPHHHHHPPESRRDGTGWDGGGAGGGAWQRAMEWDRWSRV